MYAEDSKHQELKYNWWCACEDIVGGSVVAIVVVVLFRGSSCKSRGSWKEVMTEGLL